MKKKLLIDCLLCKHPLLRFFISKKTINSLREMQIDDMYDAWHDGNENGMEYTESIMRCENFYRRTDGMEYIEKYYEQ